MDRYILIKEITFVSDYPFYWVNNLNIGGNVETSMNCQSTKIVDENSSQNT